MNAHKSVTSLDNQYTAEQSQIEHRKALHKKRLVRRLSFFIVFAVIIGGLLVTSMVTRANVLEEKLAEKEELTEQVAELKSDEKNLKNEIVKLNDDEYIAK